VIDNRATSVELSGWPCPKCKKRFTVPPETERSMCPLCSQEVRFLECPSCKGKYKAKDTFACAKVAKTPGALGRNLLASLNKRLSRLLTENLVPNEPVEFAIWANTIASATQALIACPSRVLIGKVGAMAGAPLGGLVTTFRYEDIMAIEVRSGPLNGWIEILTPAYQGLGSRVHYWSSNERNDPYKLPNCLPAPGKGIQTFMPYVERLRVRVAESRATNAISRRPQGVVSTDLASQLADLARLRDQGVLSEDEFATAKARVLG